MTPEDALGAVEAGADALVVSNHGGRVLDEMPGTARVLSTIVEKVAGRVPVLVDGGVRGGADTFKMLALGAKAVLVGRPIAIAAVGGEVAGVKFLIKQYSDELKNSLYITGAGTLDGIRLSMLLKK
jgi:isopentenyl diphosphate isomerase/L-lactate dehydrogenase-like FMN-dependent dehydrogenase